MEGDNTIFAINKFNEWWSSRGDANNRPAQFEAFLSGYFFGRDSVQQSVQPTLLTVCPKCGGWLKGGECENCILP